MDCLNVLGVHVHVLKWHGSLLLTHYFVWLCLLQFESTSATVVASKRGVLRREIQSGLQSGVCVCACACVLIS